MKNEKTTWNNICTGLFIINYFVVFEMAWEWVGVCAYSTCVRAYISPVLCGYVGAQSIAPCGHVVAGGWELLTWPPSSKRSSRRCRLRANRAAFIFTSAEPGKTLQTPAPPVSACGYRQGGKWTYRCCIVLLRLQSLWCVEKSWIKSHVFQWELSADGQHGVQRSVLCENITSQTV